MPASIQDDLRNELEEIRHDGLYKPERIISSPQSARIDIKGGQSVLNFCANNYLGLSNHPALVEAARAARRF